MPYRQLLLSTSESSTGTWGTCNYDKARVTTWNKVKDNFYEAVVEVGHTNCPNYSRPWCVNRRVRVHFHGPKATIFEDGSKTPKQVEDYILTELAANGEISTGTSQDVG